MQLIVGEFCPSASSSRSSIRMGFASGPARRLDKSSDGG
jgi:hypothetical protein